MNWKMGSQVFHNVDVPILWGTRAIIQDEKQRLSVIDLDGPEARIEILADIPAPKIEYRPLSGGGIEVLDREKALYSYDSTTRTLRGIELPLPECQVTPKLIRIGRSTFQENTVSGFGVGIYVTPDGKSLSCGAPMPAGLAKLRV